MDTYMATLRVHTFIDTNILYLDITPHRLPATKSVRETLATSSSVEVVE